MTMNQYNLTKGNVSRTLVRYAIPMIITSLFQSAYSIIDIIIAGKYIGGVGISAINNASLITNLMTQIVIGLTTGGNVLISQYYGAKKVKDEKEAIGTVYIMSIAMGIISSIIFISLSKQILCLLRAPSLSQATTYLRICAVGLPFIFGYNALSAILRALGNSKVTMYFIIISSCSNVLFDILFVAAFDMGIVGTALGTVLAQMIAFGVAQIYITRHREEYKFCKENISFVFEKAKAILRLGFPIALQWTVASISWLAVAFLLNKYGVSVSAGNGISNKIKDLCQLFISAVAAAGSTMVAQNFGAGEYERGKKVMQVCMKMNLMISTVLIIGSELLAPYLVSIFSNEIDVLNIAIINLRIEILAQVFYAGFMTFNVLATGSGDTMFVMANSFLNCIIVRLVLAFVLEKVMGVMGIYLACMIAPLSSVPVGYWYYKSEKWRKSIFTESVVEVS